MVVSPRAKNLDSWEVRCLLVEDELWNDIDALLARQLATQQGKAHSVAQLVGTALRQQHVVNAHHQLLVLGEAFALVLVVIKRNDLLLCSYGQNLTKQQNQ